MNIPAHLATYLRLIVMTLITMGASTALAGNETVPISKLRQQAEAQTPDAVAFLSKSIQFKSVEDFGYDLKADTRDMLQYAFEEAKKIGFTTRLAADGLVGVLEYGEDKYGEDSETVGVLIHVDVVPANVIVDDKGKSNWTYPPFSGKVVDGYVWGRGAQDDKGALAATLWGMKLLIDNNVDIQRKVRIILGTKEEKSFEALTRYFQEEKQPDYGIVPDGVYFIEGEKGIADLQIAFKGISAPEKARETIVDWSGGTVINSVPDLSYMTFSSTDITATRAALEGAINKTTTELKAGKSELFYGVIAPYTPDLTIMTYANFIAQFDIKNLPAGDLVLVSRGKAVHGSAPWVGRNAIIEVAFVASLLKDLPDNAYTQAARFVATRMGLDYYGNGLINKQNQGIPYSPPQGLRKPPLGLSGVQYYGTSSNLGLVDSDNDQNTLTLSIDFRTGLGNLNTQILDHTSYTVNLDGGTTSYVQGVGSHYPPIYSPGEHPVMKLAVQSYKDVNPDVPKTIPYLYFSPGTTYLKLVDNFVNFGPVDIYPDPYVNKFHQDDERISVKSLTNNIVLFAHALQLLIQADPSPVETK
ncbi:MAG: M20/M25/M40 family metallo-hydrolase [Halopseudomonas aestusnigri]